MPNTRAMRAASIRVAVLICFLIGGSAAIAQHPAQIPVQVPVLYGTSAGTAKADVRGHVLSLSNQMMEVRWSVREGKLAGLKLVIHGTGAEIALPRDPFSLILKDGASVRASEMTITDGPRVQALRANPGASRAAEHFAGQVVLVRLQDSARKISVDWRAILRDGSNYLRQEITISSLSDDQPIAEVRLFDGTLPGANVIGSVKGSPVTAGDLFLGFEDPLAECHAGETVTCGMKR